MNKPVDMRQTSMSAAVARMAQEALTANAKTAGGRQANARMGVTTVVKTIKADRWSVDATFVNGERFRFAVSKTGERLSVTPTPHETLAQLQDFVRRHQDERNEERIERIAFACTVAKGLEGLATGRAFPLPVVLVRADGTRQSGNIRSPIGAGKHVGVVFPDSPLGLPSRCVRSAVHHVNEDGTVGDVV